MSVAVQTAERLLRLPEVLNIIGLGKSKMYAMIAADEFPKPVKFQSASRWPASKVNAWVAKQVDPEIEELL